MVTIKSVSLAFLFSAVLLTGATAARAETPHASGMFGIGVVGGFPDLGLSLNYFMSEDSSLQINPVLAFGENSGAGGRIDILAWPSTLATGSSLDLDWFVGPGANFYFGDFGYSFGAELPIGIGLAFKAVPIDLNLEAVPVLHLVDDTGLNVALGIGGDINARIYF